MYLYMKHVTVETKLRKNNTAIQTLEKTLLCSPSFLELAGIESEAWFSQKVGSTIYYGDNH